MGIKIKPQPYRFRQDIEIEVFYAKRAYKKKNFDQYEKSIDKLKKMLGPLMEKWTKVKEIAYIPTEDEEEAFRTKEYSKVYYYISWIKYIETTEGYKELSSEDWDKLIDHVFRERALAYKKQGKKSSFLGYLHKWFYFYLLSAYRKIKAPFPSIRAHFHNKHLHEKFLNVVKRLPLIQKKTFEDYYFRNLTYKDIAKKYKVSESTVRNNKLKSLKNIKKWEPAIYADLKRKFRGSRKVFLK